MSNKNKMKIENTEQSVVEDTEQPVIETSKVESDPTPEKAAKVKTRKRKAETKKKGAPRAPSSYVLFSMEFRSTNKDKYSELSLGDVSKKCGEAWQTLSEEEKNVWKEKSNAKRKELLDSIPVSEVEPKKAKRQPSSYVLFALQERKKILSEFPSLKLGEVSKKCGEAWQALSDEDKNAWKAKATGASA